MTKMCEENINSKKKFDKKNILLAATPTPSEKAGG